VNTAMVKSGLLYAYMIDLTNGLKRRMVKQNGMTGKPVAQQSRTVPQNVLKERECHFSMSYGKNNAVF
jgi:hypothetical protein